MAKSWYEINRESLERMQWLSTLASYLQQKQWDVIITGTFAKRENHPHTAIEKVYNKLPFSRKAFLAAETHRLGGYHVHGLVEFSENFDKFESIAIATENLSKNGFCKVDLIDSPRAVSAYCTKYVTKELGDYEFFGKKYAWVY